MTQSRDWIDRREFSRQALLAMLAGVTVTIAGCGSEDPAAPTAPVSDKTAVIEGNHGHVATITSAQQMAGGGVRLDIQGTGSHNHVVELTASEVTRVRFGFQVVKQSDMNRNHVHAITFN
jgi:hypothetical protein